MKGKRDRYEKPFLALPYSRFSDRTTSAKTWYGRREGPNTSLILFIRDKKEEREVKGKGRTVASLPIKLSAQMRREGKGGRWNRQPFCFLMPLSSIPAFQTRQAEEGEGGGKKKKAEASGNHPLLYILLR